MPGAEVCAATRCGACGAPLAGPYCHRCGQPGPTARRRLAEALLGHTGRLAHTLRMLLTRPGELARETDECRDRDAVRPLTLLLNVVACFFLLSGLTDFRMQSFAREDATGRLAQALELRAAAAGVGRDVYVERVERRFQSVYTVLLVASVGVYAGLLWLTHRAARKSWLVHVAAAIHYACFAFLVAVVCFVVFRELGVAMQSITAVAPQVALTYAYLVLTVRRAYGDSLVSALGKGLVIAGSGVVVDGAVFVAALNVALRTA